jgi:hypothetical protein
MRSKMLHRLAEEFLKTYTVRRDGKLVTAEARTALRWVDFLQAFTPAEASSQMPKVEVREIKP